MDKRSEPLASTRYCDHDHPLIRRTAERLQVPESTRLAVARNSFFFVRDSIVFGFDLFQQKASETLGLGYGVCWNKALLLIALLRANGIPARFCSIPIQRTFIRPAIGAWHRLANDPYHHCLVLADIDDRPVLLDAVLDRRTFDAFFRPIGVDWGIDWNGKDDMRLYSESVAGEIHVHDDIDATLDRRVGNKELPRFFARIGNRLVNRQMWKKVGIRPNPPETSGRA